jgi:DNA-binding NarL/FixJ family response regulator
MLDTTATSLFVPSHDPRAATTRRRCPSGRLTGVRVLVAEADSGHRLAVESGLVRDGAEVTIARTLNEAQAEIRASERPFDAAVVALALPDGRGATLVEELRRHSSPCLAVMRSELRDRASAYEIIAAGAVEPLFSTYRADVVADAVERVVGATREVRAQLAAVDLPQAVAREQTAQPARRSSPRVRTKPSATIAVQGAVESLATRVPLTPRERVVLRFIAMGYRYQDIGAELEISARTVKMHASNMRRKLGVDSRHELLREVFEQGAPCR